MTVCGNQQATRIGYFVGILEGEGSFGGGPGYGAQVQIPNLDLDIIEACESFLKANFIWHVRYTQHRNGRPEYNITVRNSSLDVLQQSTLLYDLINSQMQCRHNEYRKILGASTTTRDPSVDLDWLAGILEAEGSFSLTLDYRKNAALAISMSNTNHAIIDRVILNLDSLRCGYHLRDKVKREPHHKPGRIIAVTGMLRCRTFLTAMTGRWVSRRHQRITESIAAFIDSRMSRSRKSPYSDFDLQKIQQVIDCNR